MTSKLYWELWQQGMKLQFDLIHVIGYSTNTLLQTDKIYIEDPYICNHFLLLSFSSWRQWILENHHKLCGPEGVCVSDSDGETGQACDHP